MDINGDQCRNLNNGKGKAWSAVKSYFREKQRKLNDYNLACDYSVLL